MDHISIDDYYKLTKESKYHNKKDQIDGHTFDSRAEARRYEALRMLTKAGVITDLMLQVKFPLVVNGIKIANYIADFVYLENGRKVVEDSKGVKTSVYKLKKRLMKAIYNIDILET